MSSVTVFVGLDYHQQSVQVCVLDHGGNVLSNRPCANDVNATRGWRRSRSGVRGHRALQRVCPRADQLNLLPG
jgi:hypothetical protein